MTIIKKFGNFQTSETLYIFDFDETIVKTPSFEELVVDYLKESSEIESMLKSSLSKVKVKLSDLKWENGRIFVKDPNHKIKIDGNWIRKGPRVYLLTPSRFPFTDISLPYDLKSLSELYSKVENKCIVTARPEDMRSKIISVMESFGLEQPKYGLHMFPAGKGSGNSGVWKGNKIIEILKNTGFESAHFYDDNSKIVNKVERMVKSELPNINFNTTRVK